MLRTQSRGRARSAHGTSSQSAPHTTLRLLTVILVLSLLLSPVLARPCGQNAAAQRSAEELRLLQQAATPSQASELASLASLEAQGDFTTMNQQEIIDRREQILREHETLNLLKENAQQDTAAVLAAGKTATTDIATVREQLAEQLSPDGQAVAGVSLLPERTAEFMAEIDKTVATTLANQQLADINKVREAAGLAPISIDVLVVPDPASLEHGLANGLPDNLIILKAKLPNGESFPDVIIEKQLKQIRDVLNANGLAAPDLTTAPGVLDQYGNTLAGQTPADANAAAATTGAKRALAAAEGTVASQKGDFEKTMGAALADPTRPPTYTVDGKAVYFLDMSSPGSGALNGYDRGVTKGGPLPGEVDAWFKQIVDLAAQGDLDAMRLREALGLEVQTDGTIKTTKGEPLEGGAFYVDIMKKNPVTGKDELVSDIVAPGVSFVDLHDPVRGDSQWAVVNVPSSIDVENKYNSPEAPAWGKTLDSVAGDRRRLLAEWNELSIDKYNAPGMEMGPATIADAAGNDKEVLLMTRIPFEDLGTVLKDLRITNRLEYEALVDQGMQNTWSRIVRLDWDVHENNNGAVTTADGKTHVANIDMGGGLLATQGALNGLQVPDWVIDYIRVNGPDRFIQNGQAALAKMQAGEAARGGRQMVLESYGFLPDEAARATRMMDAVANDAFIRDVGTSLENIMAKNGNRKELGTGDTSAENDAIQSSRNAVIRETRTYGQDLADAYAKSISQDILAAIAARSNPTPERVAAERFPGLTSLDTASAALKDAGLPEARLGVTDSGIPYIETQGRHIPVPKDGSYDLGNGLTATRLGDAVTLWRDTVVGNSFMTNLLGGITPQALKSREALATINTNIIGSDSAILRDTLTRSLGEGVKVTADTTQGERAVIVRRPGAGGVEEVITATEKNPAILPDGKMLVVQGDSVFVETPLTTGTVVQSLGNKVLDVAAKSLVTLPWGAKAGYDAVRTALETPRTAGARLADLAPEITTAPVHYAEIVVNGERVKIGAQVGDRMLFDFSAAREAFGADVSEEQAVNYVQGHEINHAVVERAEVRDLLESKGIDEEHWADLRARNDVGIKLSDAESAELASMEKQMADILPSDAKAVLDASRQYGETGEITPLMQALRGTPNYESLLTNVESIEFTPEVVAELEAQGAHWAQAPNSQPIMDADVVTRITPDISRYMDINVMQRADLHTVLADLQAQPSTPATRKSQEIVQQVIDHNLLTDLDTNGETGYGTRLATAFPSQTSDKAVLNLIASGNKQMADFLATEKTNADRYRLATRMEDLTGMDVLGQLRSDLTTLKEMGEISESVPSQLSWPDVFGNPTFSKELDSLLQSQQGSQPDALKTATSFNSMEDSIRQLKEIDIAMPVKSDSTSDYQKRLDGLQQQATDIIEKNGPLRAEELGLLQLDANALADELKQEVDQQRQDLLVRLTDTSYSKKVNYAQELLDTGASVEKTSKIRSIARMMGYRLEDGFDEGTRIWFPDGTWQVVVGHSTIKAGTANGIIRDMAAGTGSFGKKISKKKS